MEKCNDAAVQDVKEGRALANYVSARQLSTILAPASKVVSRSILVNLLFGERNLLQALQ